ncbi:hypothetical protein GIB67_024560 [Kingdonia uniflora]|uniref:MULE transposase domain-containing protein n=1 Tax=Kingdonia uniflora TaxID=39325 RepID=A0A7J7LNX5_9MAGN|nr:hypothetical protein GIB67_024560 [Kingdonia uniflora]
MCLYNRLPFVVRCIDDLRDMWAKGDESYPMRTQLYIRPTDVVREIPGTEAGEYVLLDEDDINYIISPRETKEKNTTPVKAIPVKTNVKRKGKAVIMSPSKPNKSANKPAKRQKTLIQQQVKNVVISEDEDLDNLPEVYHRKLGADNTLCNAPWVAREVEALVRDVRAMTPKANKTRMKTQYGVEISYWTAWNARQICIESIVESYDQGYHDLPSFFVKGCRPILGIDGCFLKGKYGGVYLSVLSLDANNGLFPIGVYMCRTECKESCLDFLARIEPYLSAHSGKLTFISDRQKGIIDSVAEIFPHANHRFCFRHMFKKMKKYHKGAYLERLSWGAAKAFRQNEKQEILNQLGIDIPGANDYLEKEPYEHWCRSHFDCTAKYKQ